jgi:hypothetical protein
MPLHPSAIDVDQLRRPVVKPIIWNLAVFSRDEVVGLHIVAVAEVATERRTNPVTGHLTRLFYGGVPPP